MKSRGCSSIGCPTRHTSRLRVPRRRWRAGGRPRRGPPRVTKWIRATPNSRRRTRKGLPGRRPLPGSLGRARRQWIQRFRRTAIQSGVPPAAFFRRGDVYFRQPLRKKRRCDRVSVRDRCAACRPIHSHRSPAGCFRSVQGAPPAMWDCGFRNHTDRVDCEWTARQVRTEVENFTQFRRTAS